jgi:hypothetical protein
MVQRHIQVFSSDPTLVSYLAHYLRAQSCNIIETDGNFYLRSSYFEKLPLLPTSVSPAQHSNGLGAVLVLINPAFITLSTPTQVEQCIQALLFVLNGIINLKYKSGGLTRVKDESPTIIERGVDYNVDISGQRIYTASRDIAARFVLAAGHKYFRTADKQKPSTKKIWNIARSNASVARALYHYTKSEDLVELRKAVEEIMDDTYTGTRDKDGKFKFPDWNKQKWSEPEILASKMYELWAFLHNAEMSHDRALHSVAFSNTQQANKFKAHGSTMSLQEARDIIHTLLIKWLKSKP